MSPLPVDIYHESSRLLAKLKSYYGKKEAPPPPPIPLSLAVGTALFLTFLYVAPFYLSPTLRTSPLTSRDHPAIIRARITAVTLTSILSTALTTVLLASYANAYTPDILRLFGLYPTRLIDTLNTLLLVATLFAAPLYETFLVDGGWHYLHPKSLYGNLWTSPQGFRNYVVAPLSEELIFRALPIPLFLLSTLSPGRTVLLTPLIFGLAHVHHLVSLLSARTPPGARSPPLPVMVGCVVQVLVMFGYTTLFGAFAAFAFVRTGNLWAVVLAHALCNSLGLPRFWGRVGQVEEDGGLEGDDALEMTGNVGAGGEGETGAEREKAAADAKRDGVMGRPKGKGVAWTVVYYALLVLGLVGFIRGLWPMTESPNALAKV